MVIRLGDARLDRDVGADSRGLRLFRVQPRDSIFLFFTDDAVLPRPLFGAVNLVTGLAASAAGLAMLPVDGGEMLWAGLRGALFSLPELIFRNIRKGTFDPPDGR